MLRLSLASALAATFLLAVSSYSAQAQNLKTPTERPDPTEPVQEFVSDPPTLEGEGEPFDWDNQQEIKIPVGFERWLPEAPNFTDTIDTEGAGWFYCNNLTQLDINVTFPALGFRAIDIEVEQWAGSNTTFSAVFVQNGGIYEVEEALVLIAPEQDIRDWMFGGEWSNYRMIDLEVDRSRGYIDLEQNPPELHFLSSVIAVLIVPNEGNQYTPEWDFIVHANAAQLAAFWNSFNGNVRMIDYEISIDEYDNFIHEMENHEDIVHSQIMVSDDGVEHVETTQFQYSTTLELWALEQQGWQLIDSERNIPLMYEHYPENYGLYTGLFVQMPNSTEFYQDVNGYSVDPFYNLEDKRMIDLELVPEGGSFLLDEVFLLY